MAEGRRIFRFDFSGDEPKMLDMPETKKATKKKQTVSPEKREAMRKGIKKSLEQLTPREKRFCEEYVRTSNGGQSVMAVGYNCSNIYSASAQANALLKLPKIQNEINRIVAEQSNIMNAQEVMLRLSALARGEEKDQFGLEVSADTKLKALVELAKRTVDIDNKIKAAQQAGDNAITIKLDWSPSTPKVNVETNTSNSSEDDENNEEE